MPYPVFYNSWFPIQSKWQNAHYLRTRLHKKYMWIFEHNFVADKAKIRRRAVVRQVFFTQYAAKFAEKTLVYACEDRFWITGSGRKQRRTNAVLIAFPDPFATAQRRHRWACASHLWGRVWRCRPSGRLADSCVWTVGRRNASRISSAI